MIYIVRNPKDVAVSYYYFLRMATFVGYRGGMNDFINKFIKGEGIKLFRRERQFECCKIFNFMFQFRTVHILNMFSDIGSSIKKIQITAVISYGSLMRRCTEILKVLSDVLPISLIAL